MKDQWADLQSEAPEVAQAEILKVRKAPGTNASGHRSFAGLHKVVTSWAKTKSLELADRWLECDRGEFEAHWAGRGRKPHQIGRKWAKATTAKKIRKGLCFQKSKTSKSGKVKKVTIVWVKKQRKFKDATSLSKTTKEKGQAQLMDSAAAAAEVRGDQKITIDKSSKSFFGAPGSRGLGVFASMCVLYCLQFPSVTCTF